MNRLFTILSLIICSLAYPTEPTVTHKCANFIPISVDEKLFKLALDKHLNLRKALDGEAGNLDPDKAFPIWKHAKQTAFGYDFDTTLVVFCWFIPKAKSGVFYFEGYSALEAQEFVKAFEMDLQGGTPLTEVFMFDGLVNYEKLFEAFPRLRISISPHER